MNTKLAKVRLQSYISEELREKIRRIAEREGTTESAIVRTALLRYIAKRQEAA